MAHYIIASHGTLAEGMANSLKFLLGTKPNIHFINGYVDSTDFTQQLTELLSQLPSTEQKIMFSDLYGGSINQEMYKAALKQDLQLICGFNLPLLLEFIGLNKKAYQKSEIEEIILKSRAEMKYIQINNNSTHDDSFF